MPPSWSWIFIFGAIGYGAMLGLGCGGLVAYNVWNNKSTRKLRRRREEDELCRSLRGAGTSEEEEGTLGSISDVMLAAESRRGPRAAPTASVEAVGGDDSRRPRRRSSGSKYSLGGLSRVSTTTAGGDESRRRSRRGSLDGLSAISISISISTGDDEEEEEGGEEDDDDQDGEGSDSGTSHQTSSALSCIREGAAQRAVRGSLVRRTLPAVVPVAAQSGRRPTTAAEG